MARYDHAAIEKKWQEQWRATRAHEARDCFSTSRREGELEGVGSEKCYLLIEFPYPSGDGLHVGHLRPYVGMDVIARKRRMEGKNVLYPIGWDAFGLPTENYAIKTGVHPRVATERNIATIREQIQSLGISFDWSREVNTTDPAYYKWTQWIFLKLLEHGLAYKARMPINWCPACKIGLANEEVVAGACERCGGTVEQREKEQWMLRITAYADRLLAGLDTVDYIERAKVQQRNWIGRSEGATIQFDVIASPSPRGRGNPGLTVNGIASSRTPRNDTISVFTTRPDTLFGATYLVVAPEYGGISNLRSQISNWDAVSAYIQAAKQKTHIERTAEDREKTGIELKGVRAMNPANGEEIPVWVADYVLASYGTGAIMAVPAHDERDFVFAGEYGLPIRRVIARNPKGDEAIPADEEGVYTGDGVLMNSGAFDDMTSEDAKRAITEKVGGTMTVTYKLRDWVFSRQRYWGEPIPVVFCAGCVTVSPPPPGLGSESLWLERRGRERGGGAQATTDVQQRSINKATPSISPSPPEADPPMEDKVEGENQAATTVVFDGVTHAIVPIPEDQLPVLLPEVEKYQPTDTGESPLANITEWVNTNCPRCGGPAKRETDVMPNWAGSSWYFLAYLMRGSDTPKQPQKHSHILKNVGMLSAMPFPIAQYEEAFRYWMPVDWYNGGMEHTTLHLLYSRFWNLFLHDIGAVPVAEPYAKRTSHGMILAEDGEKMSKSRGNIVNPDTIVAKYGADAVRLYEMFIGPFDQAVPWSTNGLVGCRRFLEKVVTLAERCSGDLQVATSEAPRYAIASFSDGGLKAAATSDSSFVRLLHRTIKKVTEDTEQMQFNTAVAAMMEFVNAAGKEREIPHEVSMVFLRLLAPFAPHCAEELWERGGYAGSVSARPWPSYDPAFIAEEEVDLVVQVNGKVRATIRVPVDIAEADATARALAEANVVKHLGGKQPTKIIFVPTRIINIVL